MNNLTKFAQNLRYMIDIPILRQILNHKKEDSGISKSASDDNASVTKDLIQTMRTPLSLIKMPVEKILAEKDYTDSSREDLITIKNNADKLLELVNRLMGEPYHPDKAHHLEAHADDAANDTEETQTPHTDSSKKTLLIVEDESDMRLYLSSELSPLYNIIQAANGQEAVDMIKNSRIDLVVSDIMMPLMDGCELCNFIKTNVEYSHIPVLLLTAVVGVETRIETLKSGADGYIEKPFEMELLKANIANLFKNREIFYRQFSDSPLSHFRTATPNKVENAFMEKLHAVVMKHLSDQELGIEVLTDILGTSKTTLYRKIKSNTGLNTNEYIRLCRLKKAAEMLSSQEYRINEVAYLTGFSSPSYFATSFQKQFNLSPSAFVKSLKE